MFPGIDQAFCKHTKVASAYLKIVALAFESRPIVRCICADGHGCFQLSQFSTKKPILFRFMAFFVHGLIVPRVVKISWFWGQRVVQNNWDDMVNFALTAILYLSTTPTHVDAALPVVPLQQCTLPCSCYSLS